MKTTFLRISFILILFTTFSSHAQDIKRFSSKGYFTGIGTELNQEIRYAPIYFAGDFAWQFGKKPRENFLAFYMEPQFNLVLTPRPLDIEFGTNIGLRFYQHLSPGFYLYEMIGSGPHFITADLPNQAKGFIFSDNFAIGLLSRLQLPNPVFINTQIRFRHISNASLKQPNAGVDNLNIIIGISRLK